MLHSDAHLFGERNLKLRVEKISSGLEEVEARESRSTGCCQTRLDYRRLAGQRRQEVRSCELGRDRREAQAHSNLRVDQTQWSRDTGNLRKHDRILEVISRKLRPAIAGRTYNRTLSQ